MSGCLNNKISLSLLTHGIMFLGNTLLSKTTFVKIKCVKKKIVIRLNFSVLAAGNDTWCKIPTLCDVSESHDGNCTEWCPLGSGIVH